jgi:TP901 family phage tail tape measure protein
MAINVGTLEALLTIKDQLSPVLAAAEKLIGETAAGMDIWTEAQQRAAMAMAGAQEEAQRLNAAMDEAAAAVGRWTEADQRAAMQMAATHEEALKLNSAFDSDRGLAAKLSATGKSLEDVGGKMQGAGMALLPLTAAISGAGLGALKFASDFDSAMTEALAILPPFDQAMRKQLGNTARDVALTTTQSATQAAEAYYFLASAGITSAESLQKALPQVAQFAQAGVLDMAQATEYLTDSIKALGLSVDADMGRVSDVIVKGAVASNTSVQQLAESLTTKAATSMKTFGISIEEGVAVLAAYADQGIKGTVAGERFDILLRTLTKSAMEHADAFKENGIAIYDNEGKLKNLADVIKQLEERFKGMSVGQKVATLDALGFKAESQSAILALMGMSGSIADYEKQLRAAGGTTKEIADNQMKSFANQAELLKKQLVDAGITLGTALMPTLRDFAQNVLVPAVEKLKAFAEWFAQLPEPVRSVAIAVAALAAAAGPLLLALGTMASGIGALLTVAAPLAPAIVAISTGLASAAATAAAAVAPYALVAAAVVAVGVGAYKLTSYWAENTEAGKATVKMIADLIDKIRVLFGGKTLADLEKGTPPPKNVKEYAEWFGKMNAARLAGVEPAKMAAEAQAAESTAVAAATKLTDESIRKMLEDAKAKDALKKASELLGVEVTDLGTAQKALGMAERMKKDQDALEKGRETVRKFREDVEKLQTTYLKVGKGVGFEIPPLPPLEKPKQDMQLIAEGAWKATDAITAQAVQLAKNGVPAETIRKQLEQTGLSANAIDTAMAGVGRQLDADAKKASGFSATFKQALRDLPNVILGAIQGGGDVGKSIGALLGGGLTKSLGETLTKKLGGTLGDMVGSLVPGLGSLLGSAAGGIFDKLFGGDKAKKEVNELRNEYIKFMGGLDALKANAERAGVSLTAMFSNKRDVQGMKDEIAKVEEQLKNFYGLQTHGWEVAKKAAEKYGLTLAEQGSVLATEKLREDFGMLREEYEALAAVGADTNVVIGKMAPELSRLVSEAQAAGVAIPAQWKPVIDQLVAQGKLLDANGNAYDEAAVAGLTYSKDMNANLGDMVQALYALVKTLGGDVPAAFDKMAGAAESAGARVRRSIPRPEEYNVDIQGSNPQGGEEIYAATGYSGWVTRPTTLHVAERGPEYVDVQPAGSGGSSRGSSVQAAPAPPVTETVVINLGLDLGRVIAQKTRTGEWLVDQSGVRAR